MSGSSNALQMLVVRYTAWHLLSTGPPATAESAAHPATIRQLSGRSPRSPSPRLRPVSQRRKRHVSRTAALRRLACGLAAREGRHGRHGRLQLCWKRTDVTSRSGKQKGKTIMLTVTSALKSKENCQWSSNIIRSSLC